MYLPFKVIGQLLVRMLTLTVTSFTNKCIEISVMHDDVRLSRRTIHTKPKRTGARDGFEKLLSKHSLSAPTPSPLFPTCQSLKTKYYAESVSRYCLRTFRNRLVPSATIAQETFWLQSIITTRKEPLKNNNESRR